MSMIEGKDYTEIKGYLQIARRIAASFTGELGMEEQKELEDWIKASSEHDELYHKLLSEQNRFKYKCYQDDFPQDKGWEAFVRKRRQKGWQIFRRIGQYAAVLCVGVCLCIYLFKEENSPEILMTETVIQPGNHRAVLTLADGKTIDLVNFRGNLEGISKQVKVNNTLNRLVYQKVAAFSSTSDSLAEVNEISVPRCGEYQLELSDGTVVHLNSMTRMRYPVRFMGKRREVELSGEAYFKVAKDMQKPFVVKTIGQEITVLGTEFNVSAFGDERFIKTTLVDGVVSIKSEGAEKAVVLKPNDQVIWDKVDRRLKIKEVDVSDYTAWKDGYFRFRDVRLEDIMRTIERWYDVTVEYADEETKGYTFGLNFSRNETIDPVLRIFGTNGKIKITKIGKKLIIKKGR